MKALACCLVVKKQIKYWKWLGSEPKVNHRISVCCCIKTWFAVILSTWRSSGQKHSAELECVREGQQGSSKVSNNFWVKNYWTCCLQLAEISGIWLGKSQRGKTVQVFKMMCSLEEWLELAVSCLFPYEIYRALCKVGRRFQVNTGGSSSHRRIAEPFMWCSASKDSCWALFYLISLLLICVTANMTMAITV